MRKPRPRKNITQFLSFVGVSLEFPDVCVSFAITRAVKKLVGNHQEVGLSGEGKYDAMT